MMFFRNFTSSETLLTHRIRRGEHPLYPRSRTLVCQGLQLAIPPPIESTRSTETGYVPIICRTGMSPVEIPRHLITIVIKSGVYVEFEKLNISTYFKRSSNRKKC